MAALFLVSTVVSVDVVTPSLVWVEELYVFVPLSVDVDTSTLVLELEWDSQPARANTATKAPVRARVLISDAEFS